MRALPAGPNVAGVQRVIMKGRRVYQCSTGQFCEDAACTRKIGTLTSLLPGDYWKWSSGAEWSAKCPNGLHAALRGHQVTEWPDETISVSPSILCRYDGADGKKEWHGFLEHGVWREV